MEEKLRFIVEYERDEQPMRDVCAAFGISRETGYVWLRRYRAHGVEGLLALDGQRIAMATKRRRRWRRRCWSCARRTCAGDRAS